MAKSTISTTPKLDELQQAFHAGEKAALALGPGDVFLGAWGAAEAAGYGPETWQRSVFTTTYCRYLLRPIKCNEENIIISIG